MLDLSGHSCTAAGFSPSTSVAAAKMLHSGLSTGGDAVGHGTGLTSTL